MGLLVARHETLCGPIHEGLHSLSKYETKHHVAKDTHMPDHNSGVTHVPLLDNQLGSDHRSTKNRGL
jgi:hypothetical protein